VTVFYEIHFELTVLKAVFKGGSFKQLQHEHSIVAT